MYYVTPSPTNTPSPTSIHFPKAYSKKGMQNKHI